MSKTRIEYLQELTTLAGDAPASILCARDTQILGSLNEQSFEWLLLFAQRQRDGGQEIIMPSKTLTAALGFLDDFPETAGTAWERYEVLVPACPTKDQAAAITSYWRVLRGYARRAEPPRQQTRISPNAPRHRSGIVARRAQYSKDGTHHSKSGHA